MIEINEALWKAIAGVYFIYDWEGDLLYVGRSTNIASRLATHDASKDTKVYMEAVSRVTYIPIEDSQERIDLEAALIRHIKPEWNRTLSKRKNLEKDVDLLKKHNLFNLKPIPRKFSQSKKLCEYE